MDCCNYIEAYAPGGHFGYQQQQQQQQQPPYFCYDNSTTPYTGYDAAPNSNAIDINARYNGTIPSTYPTDYVYNPKEARLRKAMREQTRELARRSILQSAIANTNARTIGGASAVSASVVGSFLNQQQPHRFDCTSVLPMSPNVSPHHATDPWFQTAHRLKSVHSSPRIGDWYGGMCGDHPIERLRAMGAMHHQQQQQQHDLEKPIKDHPALYSNGYSSAEREIRRQESAEYSDFIDGGQKWHPYQSSASPHPRAPHMSSQMGGILHPSVQNTNAHGHDPWGQFCHGMLPHVPTVARNSMMIRGPRHAVFLRDRTPTRHCAFSEDASQIGYVASKLNVDGIRASYLPEHQMPRLLSESSVDSVIDTTTTTITTTTTTTTTTTMNRREEDDGTRWEPNHVTAGMPLDELVPTSSEGTISREKERESRHSIERFERLRKKPVSKQPLPGFHQAFGSTEIGRFSRSEFFVNMVGESGDGGDANDASDCGDRSDVTGDVSKERPLLETTEAPVAAATAANVATPAPAAAATANGVFDAENNKATFATGDNAVGVRRYATLMVDPPSSISVSYCRPPTTPSWHSPHVDALIPEAYLTNSLMFPFPLDPHSILESNAVHGIAKDGRLISPRVLPNQCCWFAQFGHAITRIPDGLVTCAALLDCSNHSSDKEWVRQSATIACPIEFLTLLGNRNASCEGTISDRANPIVVVNETTRGREISREHGNEVRKRTRDDRKSDLNLQEFNDKKN